MLHWNVYIYSINSNVIKSYNVFDHAGFYEDLKKAARKFKDDKEAFIAEVKSNLMYYFWSKSEWEILLYPWLGKSDCCEKVDVYDQVMMNFDHFSEYLWNNAVVLRRRTPKKG